MTFARLQRLPAFGALLLALACGGDDGGGGITEPPGPPASLTKSGDGQNWYPENPLPAPYSVTVRDANNRAVPNVSVDWAITTGGGTLSANSSTTNSSGVASTVHTLGTATTYVVTATAGGLSTTFSANASAPPPTAAVSLSGTRFVPDSVVVQGDVDPPTTDLGDVTWTWNDPFDHNLIFVSGPTTQANEDARSSGSVTRSFTAVGTYNYTCTLHSGMNGKVIVVK